MAGFRTSLLTLFLVFLSWTITLAQDIDKNQLIGKWKFVKATTGQTGLDYKYNGDPLLTFEENGKWITEDFNPTYRQRGTWKIEKNILIRDPEVSGMEDVGPYPRTIEKLSDSELVFSAVNPEGERTFTFYFIRNL